MGVVATRWPITACRIRARLCGWVFVAGATAACRCDSRTAVTTSVYRIDYVFLGTLPWAWPTRLSVDLRAIFNPKRWYRGRIASASMLKMTIERVPLGKTLAFLAPSWSNRNSWSALKQISLAENLARPFQFGEC